MTDRELIKTILFNKRLELLKIKGDSLIELPLAKDALKHVQDKIEQMKEEGKIDKIKYQELLADEKRWQEQSNMCDDNLKKQSSAFNLIDEKYKNIDKFLQEIKGFYI